MAKTRARISPGGIASQPNTNPGSVSSQPKGGGRPSMTAQSGGPSLNDLGSLTDLLTADGKVKSYTVGYSGLRLVLKSEADKTFTLSNTAPHYGSVLSAIIAAAARDEMLTVGWMPLSLDYEISALGLGTEPVLG
jgi:hypothetical protein